MSLFIIKNDRGQFLDKNLDWSDGADANTLFRTPHKDVALNQLVELTTKDFTLRAEVTSCELDSKGRPRIHLEADQSAA